jgi:hypothetical protein
MPPQMVMKMDSKDAEKNYACVIAHKQRNSFDG